MEDNRVIGKFLGFKIEFIFLIIPFPLIILSILEIINDMTMVSNETLSQQLRFISNFVFFNTLHVILTYLLIGHLDEFISLKKEIGETFISKVKKMSLFFLILVFVMLFIGGGYQAPIDNRLYLFARVIALFAIVFPLFHNLWQVKGISIAIGHSNSCSRKYTKNIHMFFRLIFILLMCLFLFTRGLYLPWDLYFLNSVKQMVPDQIINYMKAGSYILILFVIIYPLFISGKKGVSTFLYLCRLLLFILAMDSLIALQSLFILHGVEYLFICHKLITKSKSSRITKKRIYIRFVLYSLLLLAINIPVYFKSTFGSYWLIVFVTSFTGAIVYCHYYLDRVIFRMSNPSIRKFVGHLLS